MLKRIVLFLTVSFCMVAVAFANNPTEQIKKTVDEVVRIVSDKEMKKMRRNAARR